jgi:signal peptidase
LIPPARKERRPAPRAEEGGAGGVSSPKAPLPGRHGAGRWGIGYNGTGRWRLVRRLNGHVQVDMKRLLSSLFIVLLVLLVLSRGISIATGEPFPISVISSGSMEPTLKRGDIVVWTPTRISDVHVGDIIVFKSSVNRGTSIAHRVIQAFAINGNPAFVTKGDANPDPDQVGMHAPEAYVTERNYLGKVVGLDGIPLRIPWLGLGIFWSASLQGSYFGEPEQEAYPWVLVPIVVALGFALFAAWGMRPEPESRKRLRAVFGTKKPRIRLYIAILAIWYMVLLLGSAAWAHENVDAGVGVGVSFAGAGLSRPQIYAEYVMPGNTSEASYLITNPGAMPIQVIAYVEGNGAHFFTLHEESFVMEGREVRWEKVSIHVPSDAPPGVYTARIRVFSSSLWMVLPQQVVAPLVAWNGPASVFALDILAAMIYTVVSVAALLLVAWLALAWSRRKTENLAMDEPSRWGHGLMANLVIGYSAAREWSRTGWLRVYDFGRRMLGVSFAEARRAVLAGTGAGAATVAVYFANGWTLLELAGTCALFTGVAGVLAGCRHRSELVLATCISLGIVLAVILGWPGVAQGMGGSPLVRAGQVVNVAALSLILFLLFLLPVLVIARLTARVGHAIKEKVQRLNGLEPSDL